MANGKQIVLYLADGTVNGFIDIEVINWAGKVLKIPRNDINNVPWSQGMSAGVYFLIAVDDETGKDAVYIGEAADVKKRLKQHISDYSSGKEKFYWHTAVVFLSRQLNKTHTQYIENVLKNQAQADKNYKVLTKATTYEKTDSGTKDSCNRFIAEIKMLLGLLKYKIYDEVSNGQDDQNDILFCRGNEEADAKGRISANGFTVLKGSRVSKSTVPSFANYSYSDLRRDLEQSGIIENRVFTKDYDGFKSPSAASSVVLGRPSSGKRDWKNASGVQLKNINQ